eukprot:290529-Prymnesium_polylepis.1
MSRLNSSSSASRITYICFSPPQIAEMTSVRHCANWGPRTARTVDRACERRVGERSTALTQPRLAYDSNVHSWISPWGPDFWPCADGATTTNAAQCEAYAGSEDVASICMPRCRWEIDI